MIGSGPAGCASAAALIRAGIRPTVVDGGVRSIPVPGYVEVGTRTNPGRKAWFGSTEAYAQPDPALITYDPRILARASYANGGLSRVWGATADLPSTWSDWPEGSRPQPSDVDELWELIPRATTSWGSDLEAGSGLIPGSDLSRRVMSDVIDACADGSWVVRPSTIAIQTGPLSTNMCRPCAQCLLGCPRDSIWFGGDVMDDWAAKGLVDYRPGRTVLSMSESSTDVEVRVRVSGGLAETLRARRVFVGSGPISSAAIALGSGLVDETVTIQDTATAFTGFLSAKGAPVSGFHHGLSQWWIHDPEESIFAQVYPPSENHAPRLASRLPGNTGDWFGVSHRVARHLHPVIAFLRQEESDVLRVSRRGETIIAEPDGNASRDAFAPRLRSLAKVFRKAGYFMPVVASEFTEAGTGYHLGASWPHGDGSDTLGRLPGSARIHFVDASVLPKLRIGSITPSVMVNAIRITRTAYEFDG